MNSHKMLSLALVTASLAIGGQVAYADEATPADEAKNAFGDAKVSINSVGYMSDGTGFVLNIPKILKYKTTLPEGAFFATTSSSGFNANGTVDCAFVIDNNDGSHDIILSGSAVAAEFGALVVPPETSLYNLVNNQYYGRVKIDATGILRRSNFPSEFEGCAFSGAPGEPKTTVLPAGFPTGSISFCNGQNFKKFHWITCKQLREKSISVLEQDYGLSIDRTMTAGITLFH